jgi:hypothetical protein
MRSGAAGVGERIIGIESDRLGEVPDGRIVIPLGCVHGSAIVEGRGIIRRDTDRGGEVGDGTVQILPAVAGKPPRLEDGPIGRIDSNCVAEVGDRFVVFSDRRIRASAIEINGGVVRMETERLRVVRQRMRVVVLGSVSDRTVLEGRRIIGVDPDCLSKVGDSGVEIVLFVVRYAAIVVGEREILPSVGVGRNRLAAGADLDVGPGAAHLAAPVHRSSILSNHRGGERKADRNDDDGRTGRTEADAIPKPIVAFGSRHRTMGARRQ